MINLYTTLSFLNVAVEAQYESLEHQISYSTNIATNFFLNGLFSYSSWYAFCIGLTLVLSGGGVELFSQPKLDIFRGV